MTRATTLTSCVLFLCASAALAEAPFPIPDTMQSVCLDDTAEITCPDPGEAYYGQDAQVAGTQPSYTDNGDGTVTDPSSGLMWTQSDSGVGMGWPAALSWAQEMNAGNHLGYSDWRLPNVRELQALVDYTRSPDTTASLALDPVFESTEITNEAGDVDYPYYWSSTTHVNWTEKPGNASAYPEGSGPQGDAVRINKIVRLVATQSEYLKNGASLSERPG